MVESDPSDFSFDKLPNVPLPAMQQQQQQAVQGDGDGDDWAAATSSATELFSTLVSGGPVASDGAGEFEQAASDAQALMSAVLGDPSER